ncbi:hypothetical protein ACLXBB_15055, partial [Pseudomonas aeruginosa]
APAQPLRRRAARNRLLQRRRGAALAMAERLGGGRADLLGAKRSDDRASIALARLLTERELP